MRTVNCYLILSAIGELMDAEADNGRPLDLDPDDEPIMKRAFCDIVCPNVMRWSPARRDRLKLSLAYFLNQPDVLGNTVLGNLPELTMRDPTDVRQFFLWLFEALFPGDLPSDVDVSNVEEDNDPLQMNFGPGEWV